MKKALLLLLISSSCYGFTTISEAERYADKLPEYPESAHSNLEQGDYSQLYSDLQPAGGNE